MGKPYRYIDPDIRQSESVSALSFRQRDLWLRLILSVDDQGRCLANPALIRSMAWPLEDIAIDEVDTDIHALEEHDFVILYVVSGRKYLQIKNWKNYQKQAEWMGKSLYPPPDGWEDRYRFHGKGKDNIIKSNNWDTSPLPTQLPTQLPCRDVNDDVNGDVNDDGDVKASGGDISPVQHILEKVTGIPPTSADDVKAMDEINALQPLEEDVVAAYGWLCSQGRRIYHYRSMVNPIRVSIEKRVNKPPTTLDKSKAAVMQVLEELENGNC